MSGLQRYKLLIRDIFIHRISVFFSVNIVCFIHAKHLFVQSQIFRCPQNKLDTRVLLETYARTQNLNLKVFFFNKI